MTVLTEHTLLRKYVSFIGIDRKVKWSNLYYDNAQTSYIANPSYKTCCTLLKMNDGHCSNCPIEKAFDQKLNIRSEIIAADGRLWQVSASPAYDEEGNFCGVFENGEHISGFTSTQEQLAVLKEKHHFLSEYQTDMIIKIDDQGRFINVSPSFCQLLAKSESELTGKSLVSLVHADDKAKVLQLIEKPNLPGFANKLEYRVLTSSSWRWFSWSLSTINEDNGSKISFLGVGRDIHDQKLTEESLRESERMLSALLSNLPGLVYRCKNDKDWTMEFVSLGCSDLTGYQPGDLIGNKTLSFNDIIVPEFREKVWSDWQQSIAEKSTYTGEYQIITASGEKKWVWEQGQALYNIYGETIALEGFIRDITDRKHTEIALSESEEEYRNLVENALVGVYSTTISGDLLMSNQALVRLLEFGSIEELLAVKNVNLVYKNQDDRVQMLKLMQQHGKLDDYELVWITKNNKEITVVISATLRGEIISGMVMDITHRKYSEQHLLEEKQRAEQSDKLKTAFLANISHEIRTPLNGILGFADILLEHDISKSDKLHYSTLIHNLSGQLLSIVNDILEISKIETNQIKINPSQINIKQILNKLHQSFTKAAKEKELQLSLHLDLQDDQVQVIGDGSRITQVLTHLLNNAVKFTLDGSIDFGCRLDGKKLLFYVKDTGIGILPENMELIFERFVQVEDTLTRKFGGSGLGLPISKAFIEMMGGEIYADSDLGKGSMFYFTLPYDAVAQKNVIQRDFHESRSCLDNCNILICEDDDFGYLYVNRLLTQAGATTERCINGNQAIIKCQSDQEFDIIIMDLRMPEMSGHEAARFIKKIRPSVPIIACTASSGDELEVTLRNGAFDAAVLKPIASARLLETICDLL